MSRASRSAGPGSRPSRSFDSSPIPSALIPPPIRSAETCASPRRLRLHLRAASRRERRSRAARRSAARGRSGAGPRRSSSAPTVRSVAAREVGLAAERIDELAVASAARHGVDREVAAGHVLLERDAGVADDREVAVARPGRALGARWRQLDPGGASARIGRVARVEAHADELPVHLHVLDPAVRLEQRPQPGLVDAGNDEVLVRVRQPEQLVADGAADDVGVEAERADVGADRRSARADCASRRPGRLAHDVRDGLDLDERAGRAASRPRTSSAPAGDRRRGARTPRSSPRSRRGPGGRRVVLTRLSSELPASSRIAARLRSTCSVCAAMSPSIVLVAGLEAELAGDEDEVADADRLVVRRALERRGGGLGADHVLLHRCSS